MTNPQVVISGVGLWTPDHTVTNDELVESYNTYAETFNADNAAAIAAGGEGEGVRAEEAKCVCVKISTVSFSSTSSSCCARCTMRNV